MSIEVTTSCPNCGTIRGCVDKESGTHFQAVCGHDQGDCIEVLLERVEKLKKQNIEITKCVPHEKLIDQIHRWMNLHHMERSRRQTLKKDIEKVYFTLDLQRETGVIVDESAQAVAEYVTLQLRRLVKESSKWPKKVRQRKVLLVHRSRDPDL